MIIMTGETALMTVGFKGFELAPELGTVIITKRSVGSLTRTL
jgi:hypothetical protein